MKKSKSPGSSLRGFWRYLHTGHGSPNQIYGDAMGHDCQCCFSECTAEGGGVEPQWLMSHSPAWPGRSWWQSSRAFCGVIPKARLKNGFVRDDASEKAHDNQIESNSALRNPSIAL